LFFAYTTEQRPFFVKTQRLSRQAAGVNAVSLGFESVTMRGDARNLWGP